MEKKEQITIIVSKKELALLTLTRSLGHGTIDRIGIRNGEPIVVTGVAQRIDLMRDEELDRVLDQNEGRLVSVESPIKE